MSSLPGQSDDEQVQLRRCHEGDLEALAALRSKYHPLLMNILVARGAGPIEAGDLLADLWGDCVAGAPDKPSLLEKFNGQCRLQSWLATVATNRLIDLKRKQARRGEAGQGSSQDNTEDAFEHMPAAPRRDQEGGLVVLLRDSLQAAFGLCPPEAMLLLRLVYLHGLTQREVMRMWGWSESKVSRALSHAMSEIEIKTLSEIKRRDPWLQITWQDFLDLCETESIDFL